MPNASVRILPTWAASPSGHGSAPLSFPIPSPDRKEAPDLLLVRSLIQDIPVSFHGNGIPFHIQVQPELCILVDAQVGKPVLFQHPVYFFHVRGFHQRGIVPKHIRLPIDGRKVQFRAGINETRKAPVLKVPAGIEGGKDPLPFCLFPFQVVCRLHRGVGTVGSFPREGLRDPCKDQARQHQAGEEGQLPRPVLQPECPSPAPGKPQVEHQNPQEEIHQVADMHPAQDGRAA